MKEPLNTVMQCITGRRIVLVHLRSRPPDQAEQGMLDQQDNKDITIYVGLPGSSSVEIHEEQLKDDKIPLSRHSNKKKDSTRYIVRGYARWSPLQVIALSRRGGISADSSCFRTWGHSYGLPRCSYCWALRSRTHSRLNRRMILLAWNVFRHRQLGISEYVYWALVAIYRKYTGLLQTHVM